VLAILSPIFAFVGLQGQLQVIEATSLPTVNAPLPPGYLDPASWSYTSSVDAMTRITSRKAMPPTVALPEGDCIVSDQIKNLAGWSAFQATVPSGRTVKVRLKAQHEGWFEVKTVNKWGNYEREMLQNLVPKFDPEASYTNKSSQTKIIYFIVDTTEASSFNEKFFLHFSWE